MLGANTDVLDQVAESLSADTRRMQDIRTLAQRAVFELQASWDGPGLMHLTHQWEGQASPQLAAASALLDSCAARLRAQSAAQRAASNHDGGGSRSLPGATVPLPLPTTAARLNELRMRTPSASPPLHGSPVDNAAWWRSLNLQQQRQVIEEHPDRIGNRDGVAFAARNQANRALLGADRSSLVAERARLEADLADDRFGGAFTNDDAALDHVRDKLAALAAITTALSKPGDRQLLVLDLSAERAQAAVARGDVDNADDVAVFVPGLSANVTDALTVYDDTMGQLQHRAELESRRVNPSRSATAAVVTWIGYQAPQMGWELIGNNSVAGAHAARNGAALLVPFLQGIGAARNHDVHLTLLGHSYGSTVAGLALRQNTGVDDAVFFGSPGLGTSHVQDLKLDGGHVYYIEARQDVVGDLGYFGIDPSHMSGIEHASAKGSTVVDPVTGEIRSFKEVVGHSSYLADDSTSQYNMSVVMAGVPDRRVHDDGEGVGDVLSWPVPGTYR
ncbi:MAG: alpha/beta hydrolase [Dermatophilaceae bacterium]